MGYILSLTKFREKRMAAYSILTIGLGIILMGVFYLISELFFVSGISHAFWFCFISVMIYSLMILNYCYFKMRRLSEKGIFKGQTPKFPFDLVTALFILILLVAAGAISYQGLLGKEFTSEDYGISFRYPHSLSTHTLTPLSRPAMTARVVYKILFSGKNNSPPFAFVVKVDRNNAQSGEMDPLRYVDLARTESLLVEGIHIGGKKGRRIAYSFLKKSETKGALFPQLIKVHTDVFVHDNEYIIFSYKADSAHFEKGLPQYNKILASLKWQK